MLKYEALLKKNWIEQIKTILPRQVMDIVEKIMAVRQRWDCGCDKCERGIPPWLCLSSGRRSNYQKRRNFGADSRGRDFLLRKIRREKWLF